jgi:uncharacterized protein YeaO (DUF488 family)
VKTTALHVRAWLKDAPSTSLRRWFGHAPIKWNEFKRRHDRELRAHEAALESIRKAAKCGRITLVYSSRDTEHNNAVALKDYLKTKIGKR